MQTDDDLRFDDPAEAALAHQLIAERPVPAPGFRGDLRRRLLAAGSGRPMHLWRRAATAAGCGLACFGVTGLGLVGVGPLS